MLIAPILNTTPQNFKSIDGEKTIEGQNIHLNQSVRVNGKVILRKCTITSGDANILVCGQLFVEECQIFVDEGTSLSVGTNGFSSIASTKFHMPMLSGRMITASDDGEIQLQNCMFAQTTKRPPAEGVDYENQMLISIEHGMVKNCTFLGVHQGLCANAWVNSTFENCKRIDCGYSGNGEIIDNCTFINCESVSIDTSSEGIMKNSIFSHVGHVSVTQTIAENCKFQDMGCSTEAIIFLEDGELSHCTFENVVLKDDARFCQGYGDCTASYCNFVNCRVNDCNRDLFVREETEGKIRKKTFEYSFLDEDTCEGLDEIQGLED